MRQLLRAFSFVVLCCIASLPSSEGERPGLEQRKASRRSITSLQKRSRHLNPHHKSRYYEFLNDNSRTKNTTLMDVWLCLACALGWACWFVNSLQPPDRLVFETRDSKKVWGNVLQVSLGEDILGTGIPVYHAVVDYVVEGEVDGEPLQIRKTFSTKRLLEEGFANVEILVLSDDPTTAMLMDDFLETKKDQEKQETPSLTFLVLTYLVAAVLIGTSVVGSVLVILRMEKPVFGWISMGVMVVFLYPTAIFLNKMISFICGQAFLTERPGEIIHGERMYCTIKRCHGTMNPFEVFGNEDDRPNRMIELAGLQVPSLDNPRAETGKEPQTPKRLFPNAGCGFGAFNVHFANGRPRTGSSFSSMSASQNSNERRIIGKSVGPTPRFSNSMKCTL
ncbi:hypothetical protein IV203_008449 [Nitzschia inconspicua]|uniref:Uncharacterized protein n=1 Tax=Nitzschia inconspicua TaxID=303405 RepID=A0A9K3KZ81_9STRA|nr:hypothetical protein IV203_008449 [Nitzschia inconspicua]